MRSGYPRAMCVCIRRSSQTVSDTGSAPCPQGDSPRVLALGMLLEPVEHERRVEERLCELPKREMNGPDLGAQPVRRPARGVRVAARAAVAGIQRGHALG